jgi:hypothetical protein
MKQDFVNYAMAHQRVGLATALTVAVAVVAFTDVAAAQATLPGDTQPGMQTQGQGQPDPRFKAPIGHRQPRPQDLPPSVQREETEGRATRGERALDEKLKICKQC